MTNLVKKIRTSSGDLQIDYNALANLPTISNPNLLINADFRNPVNQRGQTVYEEPTERYGVDRWLIYNGVKEEVHSGFITLKNTFNQESWFGQAFEYPLNNNESYVITVDVGTIVGIVDVCISNQNDNTVRHTLKYGINTFVVNPNEMSSKMERLIFTFGAGAAVDLGYVKLEQGITATPFVPRTYGEEFLLCKRFYQVVKYHRTFWSDIYNQEIVESIPYGIDMRAIPRVTANITDYYNVTNVTVSDDGDTSIYRIAYMPTEDGGIGHRLTMYIVADAEIY